MSNISEKEYQDFCKAYDKLGSNLVPAIKHLLKEIEVGYLDVSYRIKEYESFIEKIDRKRYANPLVDNEDFCGVRIICYFPSDIEKISDKIKEEFIVHSAEDKSQMTVDKFGYRSYHFVVSIKSEWVAAPVYRGLDQIKVELQVRTILMHAWADIEHKLQYKKKEHVPKTVQRKFYQLSALFELADEQLNEIRNQKDKIYEGSIIEQNDSEEKIDLNIDTLQAFLDKHFPDREKSDSLSSLLDDLLKYNIDFIDLQKLIVEGEEELLQFEKGSTNKLKQNAVIGYLLYIFNDEYWAVKSKSLPENLFDYFDEARKKRKK